jgi:hypothetical protein
MITEFRAQCPHKNKNTLQNSDAAFSEKNYAVVCSIKTMGPEVAIVYDYLTLQRTPGQIRCVI